MKFVERFKLLPVSSRRLLSIGIILALVVALPLFIWAVVTQRFLIIKRAATGEPGVCVAQNNIITVTPSYNADGLCHSIQAAVDAVTGSGYTVQIEPGTYDVSTAINVTGKSNLAISGNAQAGSGAVIINFNITSGGWGFLVSSSSGSIQWLTANGVTPNGLLSIKNSSNFSIGYANLHATSSHTMDIQDSNNISVYNTEIQSSAGALEVRGSNGIHITNNKIHNSDNGIAINDSQNTEITANLITTNDESGIVLRNVSNQVVNHNTLYNNAKNGHIPAIEMSGMVAPITFSNNIIAFNHGAGISFNGSTISATYIRNDLWSSLDGNYVGIPNQTGINGNIFQDPLFNSADGSFCLQSGSPAIYGNVADGEYMGYIGPCGGTPTPSPTPTPNSDPPLCGQGTIPPATGPAPLTVTLHGSGSAGNGAGIDGYKWDFENDGSWDTGVDINPVTHIYTVPGTYYPKFQVHNISNIWSSVCNYPYPIVVQSGGTPPPTVRPFQIMLKLDGVIDGSADLAKVTVRFLSKALDNSLGYVTSPLPINYVGNGIYKLMFGVWSTYLPSATDYALIVKGEKHLGTKFCEPTEQTTRCAAGGAGYIPIPINPLEMVSLDFSGIPLAPGDLPPQDGMANAGDFAKINELLVKPCSTLTDLEKMTADLDYNGCVNIRDAFLMRKTLETRYDDN